jgi:hypothetical protein
LLETRAAIGTAETPAEPISGLILFLPKAFINFAINNKFTTLVTAIASPPTQSVAKTTQA